MIQLCLYQQPNVLHGRHYDDDPEHDDYIMIRNFESNDYDDAHDYDQETININLTGPASYHKGRKPMLILAQAIIRCMSVHTMYDTTADHQKLSRQCHLDPSQPTVWLEV